MMSSSSSVPLGGAPAGLSSNWLAKTAVQVAECTPEVPSFFAWQEPAGIDFEAEIESVSRLFPHSEKDVLQRHLSIPDEDVMVAMPYLEFQGEDDDALVEKQALVCGGTLLKFNEETASETPVGSPEQCLMSPSDALSSLASPPNLMSPESSMDVYAGVKAATLPAVEAAGSPTLRTPHSAVSDPPAGNVQTIIEHVSPQLLLEQAVSQPLSGHPAAQQVTEVTRKCSVEEEEHSRMIDQALEDLKTLESMCGISSSVQTPASTAPSLHVQKSASQALASSGMFSSSAASFKKPLSLPSKSSANMKSTTVKPSSIPPTVQVPVKQEPVEEDDIQIVEEVVQPAAPKPRRTRPPRIAVTPARIAPVVAQPASQIVIVLTEDQLANIQKSGQLVLNAASLQTLPRAESAGAPARKVAAVKGQVRSAPGPVKRSKRERPSPVATVTKPQQRKTNGKEPVSGWTPQKQPQDGSEWAFPMMPAAADELPAAVNAEVADDGIPDDLQDLFMDSPCVPSLPGDDANTILEDLISGSVREHPQLFGGSSSPGDDGADLMTAACSPEQFSPQSVDLMPSPGFGADFSPSPQQVPVESWSPGVSPPRSEVCPSPRQYCSGESAGGAEWSPVRESPPSRRRGARPRPYDKPEKGGARKPPLTDEERRQRKKEQNKNAATRYRQKKKEEHELVSGDQDMLESRNKQLRTRVAGLTKELTYLRELMREVLRHRSAEK